MMLTPTLPLVAAPRGGVRIGSGATLALPLLGCRPKAGCRRYIVAMTERLDLDGRHIIPAANGTVNISFPENQRSGSANLVLNIQMLKLTFLEIVMLEVETN